MIDLELQIKLIIFSFIFGFLFSSLLEWFNKKINKYNSILKLMFSIILVTCMTIIYFVGIQKIGNAIFHIYSILSIVVGFALYDIIIKLIAKTGKKWYTLYGDNMPKRRISRASKRRLTIFGTLSVVAIIYFSFSLLYNLYTIYSLNNEKKELDNYYLELQEKAEMLKKDIEKLNDEQYLAAYAREHYLYSKDGEYILKIEEEYSNIDDRRNDIVKQLKENYVILGLGILIFLIFIYILVKGRNKSQK